jgi:hypothetical protein
MSGDTQSRHCWWLILVESLAHIADAQAAGIGHVLATGAVALDTDTRGVDVQYSENATADSFGRNLVFSLRVAVCDKCFHSARCGDARSDAVTRTSAWGGAWFGLHSAPGDFGLGCAPLGVCVVIPIVRPPHPPGAPFAARSPGSRAVRAVGKASRPLPLQTRGTLGWAQDLSQSRPAASRHPKPSMSQGILYQRLCSRPDRQPARSSSEILVPIPDCSVTLHTLPAGLRLRPDAPPGPPCFTLTFDPLP